MTTTEIKFSNTNQYNIQHQNKIYLHITYSIINKLNHSHRNINWIESNIMQIFYNCKTSCVSLGKTINLLERCHIFNSISTTTISNVQSMVQRNSIRLPIVVIKTLSVSRKCLTTKIKVKCLFLIRPKFVGFYPTRI